VDKQFKSVCVTGGAGFIGSHLVEALLERGKRVTVLDNLSVGRREHVPAAAELVVGDILDTRFATDVFASCEVVFHLAARVAIRSSFEHAVDDTRNNVVGTASVLKAAEGSRSVRKVIVASSMAVYTDAPYGLLVGEDSTTSPVSPYGVSKLAVEMLTHLMCSRVQIDSIVLRLFNTYGPRQALSPYVGVVTIFVNQLLKGENPVIFGDGEQCRDFVHVKDVARGFLSAMDIGPAGETFNIGSGRPRSINQLLAVLNRCLGTGLTGQYAKPVAGELCYSVADITKAKRLLMYEPREEFEPALRTLIEEIRKDDAARMVTTNKERM
jgi:UDP-glucose 4-epimerase